MTNTETKNTVQELISLFNGATFKEFDLDVAIENPYLFISRAKANNARAEISDNRIVVSYKDKYDTTITAIPIMEIRDIRIKKYAANLHDMCFNVRDMTYHIVIDNRK